MIKVLSAWDGVFLKGQINDLLNMIIFAKTKGFDLATELIKNPPEYKAQIRDMKKEKIIIKKPKMSANLISKKCEYKSCNGDMELYTVCCSDAAMKKQGFLTKWECNKCGKVDYDKRSLAEIKNFYSKTEEVKNGSPK